MNSGGRGIILRVTATQDADAILKIIDQKGELVTAYARAGFKSKKRFAGALQPLMAVDFRTNHKPSADMQYLEELHVRNDFQKVREDLGALSSASYIAELTEYNAQAELENTALYNLLGNCMKNLEITKNYSMLICQFELKLLALMGWLPLPQELNLSQDDLVLWNELLTQPVSGPKEGFLGKPEIISRSLRRLIKGHLGDRAIKSARFLEYTLGS